MAKIEVSHADPRREPIGCGRVLLKKLKNIAFAGDTRHFDTEIDLAGSRGPGSHESRQRQASKEFVIFLVGHGLIVLPQPLALCNRCHS